MFLNLKISVLRLGHFITTKLPSLIFIIFGMFIRNQKLKNFRFVRPLVAEVYLSTVFDLEVNPEYPEQQTC
jgi:hypothetical protein